MDAFPGMKYLPLIREGEWPELQTLPLEFGGHEATFVFDKFTSFCKAIGQPDYGTITIKVVPDASVVEMKSLRDYLIRFRDMDIFQEESVFQIFVDYCNACNPIRCEVTGDFAPRGDMRTIAKFVYERV
jgi:7-cyano-7-deazaguanine reductase